MIEIIDLDAGGRKVLALCIDLSTTRGRTGQAVLKRRISVYEQGK